MSIGKHHIHSGKNTYKLENQLIKSLCCQFFLYISEFVATLKFYRLKVVILILRLLFFPSNFKKLLQVNHLSCIKQYVLGYFILIYFSSIVKQALFCLCKSRSNQFLEPTSTKQLE